MKKILFVIFALVLSTICTAQTINFPSREVKIVTSLPAGSGPDSLLRKIAQQLSVKWKVPVVIENKPGGSGSIGLQHYNKEPASGHTLYLADNGVILSYPVLFNDQEIIKNIKPVAPVTQAYMMVIGSPQIKNFQELETAIRKKPMFGSWGVGSSGHLSGLELGDNLGIKATHVPYKEYHQWYTDTSNQELSFGFSTIASSTALEQAGKLKYFAYSGPTRHPNFPNVPTLREASNLRISLTAWIAFYVNKNVPQEIVSILHRDLSAAVVDTEVALQMSKMNYTQWTVSIAEFEQIVSNESKAYRQIANKYNIKEN